MDVNEWSFWASKQGDQKNAVAWDVRLGNATLKDFCRYSRLLITRRHADDYPRASASHQNARCQSFRPLLRMYVPFRSAAHLPPRPIVHLEPKCDVRPMLQAA